MPNSFNVSLAFPHIIFVVVSVALRPFYELAHIFAFALPDSRQTGRRPGHVEPLVGTMSVYLFASAVFITRCNYEGDKPWTRLTYAATARDSAGPVIDGATGQHSINILISCLYAVCQADNAIWL